MSDNDKVVFATSDVTLHKSRGKFTTQFGDQAEDVEGVVLRPGETLPLNSLAEYQREAAEKGELFGVEVLSQDEAAKKTEEVERIRAQHGAPIQNLVTTRLSGPDADDGSFSDHKVTDAERVANHAARGAEEAGEAGTDSKVTVAGAEEDNSPAQSGRKTRKTSEVQGSGGEDAASEEQDDSSDKE